MSTKAEKELRTLLALSGEDGAPDSASEAASGLGSGISGIVGIVGIVSLGTDELNRDDTAEWASAGRVLATDEADVILSGDSTSALLVGGDGGREREVTGLTVSVPASAAALEVLGDGDLLPVGAGAVVVDHARIGAGTVGVDLVESHLDLTTLADLRELVTSLGHDGLGPGLEVIVASSKSLAEAFSSIASESGGILLEGVSASAVTGSGGVDTQGHARATGIASSVDDGTVSGDELGGEENGGEDGGLERHLGLFIGVE